MGLKISGLTALTGASTATVDVLAIVDTSAVETKQISIAELLTGLGLAGPFVVQGSSAAIKTTIQTVESGIRKGGQIVWTGKASDMTAQLGQYDYGWEFLFTPGATATVAESSIVTFGVPKWFGIRSSLAGIGPILSVRDNLDALDLNFRMNKDTKYGEIYVGNTQGDDALVTGSTSLGLKFGVASDSGAGTYTTTFPFVIPGDGNFPYFTLGVSLKLPGAGSPRILFANDNASLGNLYFPGGTGDAWLNAFAGIMFGTGSTIVESNERMRITSGGLVGIGGTPNAAALLDVASTTLGFLPPRMTTAQRDLISTPPAGLVIYNTTTNKLNVRAAAAWEAVTSA